MYPKIGRRAGRSAFQWEQMISNINTGIDAHVVRKLQQMFNGLINQFNHVTRHQLYTPNQASLSRKA